MQKRFTLAMAVAFVMLTASMNAQNSNWCGSDAVNNAAEANNPLARQSRQQLADFTADYIKNNPPSYFRSSSTVQYIIPVVFHIIHNYGPENISDAQIYDEIYNLNRNYQGLRTDTAAVYATFKPIIADVQIEFRLAQLDPNGDCTNGIERIVSPLTYAGGDAAKLNPWPYNKYLNIWTVSVFDASHAGAAAYAYKPGNAPAGKDGIISLSNYVGSIGTSSVSTSYTLTHEIGHWLNLSHTWGNTNQPGVACGDDGISDTPITKGYTSCPSPANAQICNPPIVENYQNYMDYSYCYYMFTNGQKAAMWAALNSGVGSRSNVHTANNLAATGTDGSAYVCTPAAFFDSRTVQYLCEGASLLLNDMSQNIDSTGNTFTWASPGASPNTATGKQASLTFPTAGTYDVSLTVSNSAGSDTYTATNYVVVTSGALAPATPFIEGFEVTAIPGTPDWFLENESVSSSAFQTSNLTAFTGSNCLRLQNYSGNTSGTKDVIVSPAFSLVNTTATRAYFRVAYANRGTGSGDILKGFVSSDCGATWTQRYVKTASQLQTVTNIVTTNFTPVSGSIDTTQWRHDFMNLGSFSNQPNVRIKFEFTFDTGNNLYIDDINISGTVGINNINIDADELTLAPNPANGNTKLNFKLIHTNDVVITITDVLGKQVEQISKATLTPGDYSYPINTPWSKGVYFVQVASGEQFITKKLIVQ